MNFIEHSFESTESTISILFRFQPILDHLVEFSHPNLSEEKDLEFR